MYASKCSSGFISEQDDRPCCESQQASTRLPARVAEEEDIFSSLREDILSSLRAGNDTFLRTKFQSGGLKEIDDEILLPISQPGPLTLPAMEASAQVISDMPSSPINADHEVKEIVSNPELEVMKRRLRLVEPHEKSLQEEVHAIMTNVMHQVDEAANQIRNEITPRLTNLEMKSCEHVSADAGLASQIKETCNRIEKEENARASLERRLVKSLDAALLPLQTSISNEARVQMTNFTNLQSAVHVLRLDMESESVETIKEVQSLRRHLSQMEEDASRGTQEQLLSHDRLRASVREIQQTIEHMKREHISHEEMTRKLALEDERVRGLEVSALSDEYHKLKHDINVETRNINQNMDMLARQQRQGVDELFSLLDDYTAFVAEGHNREVTETSRVQNELNDWREFHQKERQHLQHALDNVEKQLHNEIGCVRVQVAKDVDQCKMTCDALQRRIESDLHQHRSIMQFSEESTDGADSNELLVQNHSCPEALTTLLKQVVSYVEKDARSREATGQGLNGQLKGFSFPLEDRSTKQPASKVEEVVAKVEVVPKLEVVPKVDIPPKIEVAPRVEVGPKVERPENDFLEQVRSLTQKHLEGNLNIWRACRTSTDKQASLAGAKKLSLGAAGTVLQEHIHAGSLLTGRLLDQLQQHSCAK